MGFSDGLKHGVDRQGPEKVLGGCSRGVGFSLFKHHTEADIVYGLRGIVVQSKRRACPPRSIQPGTSAHRPVTGLITGIGSYIGTG